MKGTLFRKSDLYVHEKGKLVRLILLYAVHWKFMQEISFPMSEEVEANKYCLSTLERRTEMQPEGQANIRDSNCMNWPHPIPLWNVRKKKFVLQSLTAITNQNKIKMYPFYLSLISTFYTLFPNSYFLVTKTIFISISTGNGLINEAEFLQWVGRIQALREEPESTGKPDEDDDVTQDLIAAFR